MTQKTSKLNKAEKSRIDEHELLQHEDFQWLGQFRDIMSPYWSSRVENLPEQKGHGLILEGIERQTR